VHVLIVEGEAKVAQALKEGLEREGYELSVPLTGLFDAGADAQQGIDHEHIAERSGSDPPGCLREGRWPALELRLGNRRVQPDTDKDTDAGAGLMPMRAGVGLAADSD
jgi:hypothetical protein